MMVSCVPIVSLSGHAIIDNSVRLFGAILLFIYCRCHAITAGMKSVRCCVAGVPVYFLAFVGVELYSFARTSIATEARGRKQYTVACPPVGAQL